MNACEHGSWISVCEHASWMNIRVEIDGEKSQWLSKDVRMRKKQKEKKKHWREEELITAYTTNWTKIWKTNCSSH